MERTPADLGDGAPRDADGPRSTRADDSTREAPKSRPPPGYQSRATVAAKAFGGLLWMATTGLGSRVVSLVATLLLTRYVDPDDYGEVQNTFVVVWMLDLLTQLGLPQYIASRADIGRKHIQHAILFFHLFGAVGLGLCLVLARPLGPSLGTPHMHWYMPGFVVGTLLQRIATIPDRLLVRQLRFRASGTIRAGAEIFYAAVTLALAAFGWRIPAHVDGAPLVFGGGFAIMWGGVARGLFLCVATFWAVHPREWLSFVRPDRETTRQVLSFGVPITVAGLGSLGARRWDNLVMARLHGAAASGIYNFAYNLADVPPTVVGEALGDVLAPSFAKVEPRERPNELARWIGISSIVCFPLGVGLSAVAGSLQWMFNERWSKAAPMLVLLGVLSLSRPVIGTMFSYLQVLGRTRSLMALEWMKAIGVVVVMYGIGRATRVVSPSLDAAHGPVIACSAIVIVYVANTVAYQIVAARAGGFSARRLMAPMFRPLVACAPMILGVLLVRLAFGPAPRRSILAVRLACEVLLGALVYAGSAWVVARRMSLDLIDLAKSAIARRRGG